jgi:hypothetical protein
MSRDREKKYKEESAEGNIVERPEPPIDVSVATFGPYFPICL